MAFDGSEMCARIRRRTTAIRIRYCQKSQLAVSSVGRRTIWIFVNCLSLSLSFMSRASHVTVTPVTTTAMQLSERKFNKSAERNRSASGWTMKKRNINWIRSLTETGVCNSKTNLNANCLCAFGFAVCHHCALDNNKMIWMFAGVDERRFHHLIDAHTIFYFMINNLHRLGSGGGSNEQRRVERVCAWNWIIYRPTSYEPFSISIK